MEQKGEVERDLERKKEKERGRENEIESERERKLHSGLNHFRVWVQDVPAIIFIISCIDLWTYGHKDVKTEFFCEM